MQTDDDAPRQLAGVPVLIVEDDPATAMAMSAVLEGEGCDVRVAATAEDALAQMSVFAPSAIVIDVVLPGMSGVSLARELRDDRTIQNLVIVAVSALDGVEVERLAREAGCATFVQKPIDPISFPELLVRHLAGASRG